MANRWIQIIPPPGAEGGIPRTISIQPQGTSGRSSQHSGKRAILLALRALLPALLSALIPAIALAIENPSADDYSIPPAPPIAQQLRDMLAPPPAMEDAPPSAHSDITLLVLYDPALPDAQATIRDLVDITNAAYLNSGINLSFRVVATSAYAAASVSNSDALNEITLDAGVQNTRDLFGADMVALLRPFAWPEQRSCGNAWVTQVDPYVATDFVRQYAFSVVSVGQDGDFFCDQHTLAHELGHNFGAVHDRANTDPNWPPRLPYAYGWGFSGQFGTIMSYLSPAVPYFSTPDLASCNGYVCGDPAEADVVRAINEVRDAFAALSPDVGAPESPVLEGVAPAVDSVVLSFSAAAGGPGADVFSGQCGEAIQTGAASPITVGGLMPDTPYSCSVVATNAAGQSPRSSIVQTRTLPIPPPVITRIEASDEALTIYLTPGEPLGNYQVNAYTVYCGALTASSSVPRITLSGLENGSAYVCSAVVETTVGTSSASASASGTPEYVPSGLNIPLIKSILDSRL